MSRKKEMEFASWFRGEIKSQQPTWFYYKIPDTPGRMRFKPTKPFDAVMGVPGAMVAIEFKYSDKLEAVGYNDLRESQIGGLAKSEESGNLAYVIWEIKLSRGKYGLLFFSYNEVKAKGQWYKDELIDLFRYRAPCTMPMTGLREYDLSELLMDIQLKS